MLHKINRLRDGTLDVFPESHHPHAKEKQGQKYKTNKNGVEK